MDCTGHSHDHEHSDDAGVSLREYVDITGTFCLNGENGEVGFSFTAAVDNARTVQR